VHPIAAKTAISDANVIGPLKSGHLVIIRGTFRQDGKAATHWMLATLFKSNSAGKVTALVANDPWTAKQVLISPTTKHVVSPAGFPLAGFTVDGYQVVTLK
jgi:hypothetical protein